MRHSQQKNHVKGLRTAELLSLLSRPGALQILLEAENGIKLEGELAKRNSQTVKERNTRILQLTRAGLVKRIGKMYMQTAFGADMCKNYIPRLEAVLMNQA